MRLRPFLFLVPASCALAAVCERAGLPAGLLLGPMVVAIAFAASGRELALAAPLTMGAQAVIGLLIAQSLNLSMLETVRQDPWVFLGGTLATLAASIAIGWLLARWRIFPGAVALWGSMPGAATAMVLIARDQGAEWQLVAVMSYLRVILVAALASTLAAATTRHGGSLPPGGAWFPAPDMLGLFATAGIGLVGAWGGKRVGMPAAALLGPMVLGAVLENTHLANPQLPGWLLALSYLFVGWRIGLGFTPEIVAAARRAAWRLLIAIAALILFCAGCGLLLARLSGQSPMTAYLAMSPGGADSVAIIASSTPVDVAFVMAMQISRFIAVLVVGPMLARRLGRPAKQ